MKLLHLSIIAGIGVVIIGILIAMSNISVPSQSANQTQYPGTPALPKIIVLINGTNSAQQSFLQFNVKPGQNILLLVNVTSDPQNLPINLSVGPRLGFSAPQGVDWKLSSNKINDASTTVLLHLSIDNNTSIGKYPMEVDANTAQIPNVKNFTLSVNFDLVVTKQT